MQRVRYWNFFAREKRTNEVDFIYATAPICAYCNVKLKNTFPFM